MFLYNNHGSLHPVIIGFLSTFFYRIDYRCHVTQIHRSTIAYTHYDILHFFRVLEFSFHTQGIGITAHIESSTRSILIFSPDNGTDGLNRQIICFQFVGITINIHLTLRRTGNGHRSHTGNTSQRIYYIIIQYLIQSRLTFFCLNGQQQDRNHIRTELKDNRSIDFIGKLRTHHIQFITHIISQHINIIAIFEFQSDN